MAKSRPAIPPRGTIAVSLHNGQGVLLLTARTRWLGLRSTDPDPGPGYWTYFFENEVTGEIKIGTSGAPNRRVVEIEREVGAPVLFLGAVPSVAFGEYAMHVRFKEHWLRGEWFAPSARDEAVAIISEFMAAAEVVA